MVSVRFASYTRPPRARRNRRSGVSLSSLPARLSGAAWRTERQGPNAVQKHSGSPEGLTPLFSRTTERQSFKYAGPLIPDRNEANRAGIPRIIATWFFCFPCSAPRECGAAFCPWWPLPEAVPHGKPKSRALFVTLRRPAPAAYRRRQVPVRPEEV